MGVLRKQKIAKTQQNASGAKKENTSGKTNKNLNNAEWTKFTDDTLPQTKPPKLNEPTTKTSPDKLAATYPVTKTNALQNTCHTDLHNGQEGTTTEAAQTRTAERQPSTQWAKGQARVGGLFWGQCHASTSPSLGFDQGLQ